MKRKLTILMLTLLALCAIVMAGCGKDTFRFPSYGFENPPESATDWRDLATDEGMTVDGALDEGVWDGLKPSSFTGDGVTLTTRAYLGETGVYFGLESDEPWVFYNRNRTVYDNTSIELYVAEADASALDKNVVQLRVGADGYTEQYIGVRTDPKYEWTRVFVPNMARVRVDGNLNAGDARGLTYEIFMPYTSIGLDAKPDALCCMAAFNRIHNANDDTKRLGWFGQTGDINNPSTYMVFDTAGMRTRASKGFSASGDTVSQTYGADQFYFFNDEGAETDKYYFEAQASVRGILGGDRFPKFGIMAARNDKNTVNLFVDCLPSMDNPVVLEVGRNAAGNGWEWPGEGGTISREMPLGPFSGGEDFVKLAVLRDGGKFYYFANDTFFGYRDDYRGLGAGEASGFGLYTMNSNVLYRNLSAAYGQDADRYYGLLYTTDLPDTLYLIKDEPLDLGRFHLYETQTDGSKKQIAPLSDDAVTLSGVDTGTVGDYTLTIGYNGRETTAAVKVVYRPSAISVKSAPKGGRIGRPLDFTGAALTVTDESGVSEMPLTAELLEGYDPFLPGTQTVTASFAGVKTTFTVTLTGVLGPSVCGGDTGFDLTGDTASTRLVRSTEGGDRYVYFSQIDAPKYYLETSVTLNEVYNGDEYPKFGLYAARGGGNKLLFLVDAINKGDAPLTNKWVLAVDRNEQDTDWNWPAGMRAFSGDYTGGKFIKLAVARDGDKFYFFVNDQPAGVREGYRGLGPTDNSTAGFYTMNASATYKDYAYTTDPAAVDAKIAAFLPQDRTVDGNDDDWAGFSGRSVRLTATDDSGKSADFRGYLGGDGLYFIATAVHGKSVSGDPAWFNNTNLELFIGGGRDGDHQRWVSLGGSSKDLISASTVTETDSDPRYATTFELFIPSALIPGFKPGDKEVRVGFAFKTPGDTMDYDGFTGSEYWFEKGHTPDNPAEQYYLTAAGILAEAPAR